MAMLNHLIGSEPGTLAAFGVALLFGVRSLRNKLQQSRTRTAPSTSVAPRVPQFTERASLRKAA